MAAFTSKAAGNWSASGQTTWNQVGVPGDGDTVTFSHDITVDVNTTVGADSGDAIISSKSAVPVVSITIATGVTLTVKGNFNNVTNTFGWLVLNHGATLKFYPPSATTFSFIATWDGALVCNGTSGSRCTVTTDKSRGGNNSVISCPSARYGLLTAAFTDFSHFGTAGTTGGIQSRVYNNFSTDIACSITDCTFTDCNYTLEATATFVDLAFTFARNIFTSSVGYTYASVSRCAYFNFAADPTTGARSIDTCSFDLSVAWATYGKCGCTNNVFAGGTYFNAGTWVTSPASWANNFIYSATDGFVPRGAIQNCYIACFTASNPHFMSILSTVTSGTFSGLIFEATDPANNGVGDCIFTPVATGAITIQNCLVLPTPATGYAAGFLVNAQGGSTMATTVEHNTWSGYNAESGMIHLAETGTSYAGEIASCRANLCWFSSATTYGFAVRDTSATPATNAVTVAGYNAFFNPSTGTCKWNTTTSQSGVTGYDLITVSVNHNYPNTSVGTGDITADPQFVDSTRALATWSTSQGGAGTVADAIARLQANPALVGQAGTGLLAWVRAGWVPRNTALQAASFPSDPSTTDAAGTSWPGGSPGIGALAVQAVAMPEGGRAVWPSFI